MARATTSAHSDPTGPGSAGERRRRRGPATGAHNGPVSHHRRPPRIEPGPGQESVWDYPRPPRLEATDRLVVVRVAGREIARTTSAYRVLETSHPPTWYLPPASVTAGAVVRSRRGGSVCEWKGAATYWDVLGTDGGVLEAAGWSYQAPTEPFRAIAGHLSFYPALLECTVDGERVRPQEGGFYGGWVTDEIVGPFKGSAGTSGW
jgi:uncharacterized protein (DUF427 family)